MCGIAGFRAAPSSPGSVLRNMVGAMSYRGPDSDAFFEDDRFHGGMCRLSINDVAHGDQPFFTPDQSVVVFYNGEIYNHERFRSELSRDGVKFRSSSDGEILPHLYKKMGLSFLSQLDGMFAISIWDREAKKLILARDFPGEKPLYYRALGGSDVAYSSDLRSLAEFGGESLELNRQAIWDYPTFLWVPQPDTIFSGVKMLMPGHVLIADGHGIQIERFLPEFGISPEKYSDREAEELVYETVKEAVESRLLSDVQVGSFLSSGLDSSIVTSLAAKKLRNLKTFTIGFEKVSDPYHGSSDESEEAARFASELGTDHTTVRVTSKTFFDSLKTFSRHANQPFAVSSGLGILEIARVAREQGVKVLLTGDGADEIFGGYSWYSQFDLRSTSAGQHLPNDQQAVSMQSTGVPLASRLEAIRSYAAPERAWAWHYYGSEFDKGLLFNREFFGNKQESSLRHFQSLNVDKYSDLAFMIHDRAFYLPNEMLQKVDLMTMAHSVEGRAPFVAKSVLKLATTLEPEQFFKGGQLKSVLRRAFAKELPSHVTSRPKHGFNVPIDHWLKGEWEPFFKHSFSSDSALARLGIINKDALKSATQMRDSSRAIFGHTLLCFMMLNLWLEEGDLWKS